MMLRILINFITKSFKNIEIRTSVLIKLDKEE